MKMQFKDRLKQLRKNNKITQEHLAKIIGVERSTIGKYESTNTIPSNEILIALSKYFNVSIDYLLGNKAQDQDIKYDNISLIKKKKFPLLGEIACGQPIFASEERESYVMTGTDINADFCLKAKGDSMIGARILDGDIVFIKQMPMVNNGDIAAVAIGDEATLKRVYYYPEKAKLVLQAENPKYEPLVYIGEELNEIRILGKAVAFQSDII